MSGFDHGLSDDLSNLPAVGRPLFEELLAKGQQERERIAAAKELCDAAVAWVEAGCLERRYYQYTTRHWQADDRLRLAARRLAELQGKRP